MNIYKMTSVPLVAALFFGTALAGHSAAYAGFQTGHASSYSSSSPVAAVQPLETEMDGTSVGQPSKVFEVYNERYVPDSVRKKYNLDESWFEKNNPPEKNYVDTYPVNNAPVTITPEETVAAPAPVAVAPAPMRARAPVEVKSPVESWRGRKGENIHDVMQRWAARAGTQLMWASADTPSLQKDFTFVGKFQEAVNELIRVEGGNKIHSQYRSEGLNPVMMTPASTVTTSAAPVSAEASMAEEKKLMDNPLAQVFQPKQVKQEKPETRWFALSGAPLAEVVRVWAEDAGVAVIWQSERNFAVKESISQVGYFEDAVFRAFQQYDNESIRPVGEMYRDPQSGQQVLLVRTDVK